MRGDLLSLISFMSNFHKNALSFYIVLLRIFCFFTELLRKFYVIPVLYITVSLSRNKPSSMY